MVEQDQYPKCAEAEHKEEDSLGIVMPSAYVKVYHRRRRSDPGIETPDIVCCYCNVPRGEDEPDTGKGCRDNNYSQCITLLTQEEPGKKCYKERVGHIQDICLGHRPCLDSLIEAEYSDSVSYCSTNKVVVFSSFKALSSDKHRCTYHQKT